MTDSQGDSGGPLLQYQKGSPVIMSITSFGVGCADIIPVGYTRVSAFMGWTKSTPAIFYTDNGVVGDNIKKCKAGEFVFILKGTNEKIMFCRACPSNRFSLGGNVKGCLKCKNGLRRRITNGAKCSCTGALARGRGLKKGRCVVCRKGTFSGSSDRVCKPCPPGTTSRKGSGGCPPVQSSV